VVVGITIVVMFVQAVTYGSLPSAEQSLHAPPFGLFVAGVALLVIDMLSYGPFVSDYSRYLPSNSAPGRVFSAIYLGNVIATIAACSLGAYITALLPKLGTVAAIGKVSGSGVLVIMALSLVNADTLNGYTGSFQLLSLVNMFTRLKSSATLRIALFLVSMVVGMVVALLGYKAFVGNLSNFLDVLLVIFIPWSAVNLTDYFIVRHARYDVSSFFTASGQYGWFVWQGLLAYAIGLAVEFPFVSQTYFTGFMVKHLGGADISWLVGFVVAVAAYLVITRFWPVSTANQTEARLTASR
jgi:nucleobase:cation symporter-1, NCS1 family